MMVLELGPGFVRYSTARRQPWLNWSVAGGYVPGIVDKSGITAVIGRSGSTSAEVCWPSTTPPTLCCYSC